MFSKSGGLHWITLKAPDGDVVDAGHDKQLIRELNG